MIPIIRTSSTLVVTMNLGAIKILMISEMKMVLKRNKAPTSIHLLRWMLSTLDVSYPWTISYSSISLFRQSPSFHHTVQRHRFMSSHRAIASTIAVVLKAGVADTMATLAVTRKVPGIYLVAQNKAKPLLVA